MSGEQEEKEYFFSVVIPAYNEEKRIFRAIESVLDQTFVDYEIIVVDDGSTDKTSEVVQKYIGGSNVSITCIRQQNQGLSAARNTGGRAARGKFVALLDSDDRWYPWHLQDIYEILNANPDLKWCCTAFERCDEKGMARFANVYRGKITPDKVILNFFKSQSRFPFALPSAMAVDSRTLLNAGGFDESIKKFGEDLDMWLRLAVTYPRIGYSKRVSVKYYWNPSSITANQGPGISERYYGRILKTEQKVLAMGEDAYRRSLPLTMFWIKDLLGIAISERNISLFNNVRKKYSSRFSLFEAILLFLCSISPRGLAQRLMRVLSLKNKIIRFIHAT